MEKPDANVWLFLLRRKRVFQLEAEIGDANGSEVAETYSVLSFGTDDGVAK